MQVRYDQLVKQKDHIMQDSHTSFSGSPVAAERARQRTLAASGETPRAVRRGERNSETSDERVEEPEELSPVFVDWLSFTWDETASWLPMEAEICALLSKWMGKKIHAEDLGHGGLGFKHSSRFWVSTNGASASMVAKFYRGGDSQRGKVLLQIDGTGCSLIRDFSEVQCLIDSIGAKITRCDLAIDDYKGSLISVDKAVQWHREGQFSLTNKLPKTTCAGDWHMPEQGLGRTLYIGARKNGKVCRVYEKGRQLGNKLSSWTRFEVEILSRDRLIPTDILTNPAKYLAAQYPVTQTILQMVGERIRTIKNEVSASLDKAVKHAIVQCGALVNYLRNSLSFTDSEVVSLIRKDNRTPARLARYAHMQVPDLPDFRANILRGFSALQGA